VISYADMTANEAGYQFYAQLYAAAKSGKKYQFKVKTFKDYLPRFNESKGLQNDFVMQGILKVDDSTRPRPPSGVMTVGQGVGTFLLDSTIGSIAGHVLAR